MAEDITPGRPLRMYDSFGGWTDFSTDELVGRDLNHFKGWRCAAGSRNISIKPDGTLRAASCGVGGVLGNIFTQVRFPEKWAECPFAVCSCGADLFIPKAKTEINKLLLRKTKGKSRRFVHWNAIPRLAAAVERTHSSPARQVYWEITHRCNYDCSYCAPWVHNKTDAFRSFEEILLATERLCEGFGRGEPMNIIFSGGEPTLQPGFLDLVRLLSSLDHHVSVHSNGSRLPAYYKQLVRYCDINLSLHFEFWKPERFLKVVETIAREKAERLNRDVGHLEVKIMMPPGGLERAMEVERQVRSFEGFSSHCTISVVPIRVGDLLETVNPAYSKSEAQVFGDL